MARGLGRLILIYWHEMSSMMEAIRVPVPHDCTYAALPPAP